MDTKCPLCNGLVNIYENCPWCQIPMENQGPIEDFFEPYNPYVAKTESKMKNIPENECVHLFLCPKCGYDTRISISEILI